MMCDQEDETNFKRAYQEYCGTKAHSHIDALPDYLYRLIVYEVMGI